jgi:very-short-patch-repair endonuclease
VRRDVDEVISRLASRRAGAFHRREVRNAGGDKFLVRRREAAGAWRRWGRDVFTLASYPPSDVQRCWLALLAAGSDSRLGFQTAGELHRLDGVDHGLVAIVTRRSHRIDIPGAVLHQLDDVRPHHRATVAGLPATTPARTIIDLSSVLPQGRLRVAVEDAIVRRLVTLGRLDTVLRDVRRPGKPGIATLVRTLDDLAGQPPPASELERLLHTVAERAGVALVRQHPLPGRPGVRGVVDGAVVASKLVVEADGRRWHARTEQMASDRRRDREAARVGWLTLRFVHEDLVGNIDGCVDDLATTHAHRLTG